MVIQISKITILVEISCTQCNESEKNKTNSYLASQFPFLVVEKKLLICQYFHLSMTGKKFDGKFKCVI